VRTYFQALQGGKMPAWVGDKSSGSILQLLGDLCGTRMIRDRKAKAAVETQCDILEAIGHVIVAFTFI